MKICSKCKLEKNEIDFTNHKTTKDGLDCWCRSCRKARYEIRKAYFKKYYSDHREQFKTRYEVKKTTAAVNSVIE